MDLERELSDLRSKDWEIAVRAAEHLQDAPGDLVTRALAAALDAHDTAITDAAARSLIIRNEPGTADFLWKALTTLDGDVTDQIWDVILWDSENPVSREIERRYKEAADQP